jgi:pimeloyl-ACP methyl ester carboxylesterase
MNVLFFSYRGAWGSGGTFSFTHALEDVASTIHWVRADSSVQAFGIDSKRVILAGHSMGGWLALMGAAADSSIACIVALDFWNVGGDGRRMRSDRQLDSNYDRGIQLVHGAGWSATRESGAEPGGGNENERRSGTPNDRPRG